MKNAADLLLARKCEKRLYCTGGWYPRMLLGIAEKYGSALKLDGPLVDDVKLVHSSQKGMRDIVQVKHLICEGSADATIIERHFGVKLPDDVHEFYSKIVQCTLALRWVIRIHSPAGVVALEEYRRSIETKVGLPPQPIRLIRFAETQEGDCVAFRQRRSDDKWIIGVACHELGLEELQSELYDQPPVDEDMVGWMERMIETHGFPLDKENQFERTYIGLP